MSKIKLFENWLAEDDMAATKGCTTTIASCAGKNGNSTLDATTKAFTVNSVSGDAKVNGAPVKAGQSIATTATITMTGQANIKLSSTHEDAEIKCDGKTATCTITGKE